MEIYSNLNNINLRVVNVFYIVRKIYLSAFLMENVSRVVDNFYISKNKNEEAIFFNITDLSRKLMNAIDILHIGRFIIRIFTKRNFRIMNRYDIVLRLLDENSCNIDSMIYLEHISNKS
jgi:hypothetical protein